MSGTQNDNRNRYGSVARYAGLAMQLLVLMGLATWGGIKLDQLIRVRALFVIILPLAALLISLWQIIRSLSEQKS